MIYIIIVFLAMLDCGKVTPQADSLVLGGARARHGELPWHVGVYQKTSRPYRQICGGSIVSRKLVISAAHCFWNTVEKAILPSRYAVAAGKLYKPWDEAHDPDAQHSNVSELLIPPLFRGVDRNFAEDLALLVLERPFEYKPYLRPVCLDFEAHLEERQLRPGTKGKVAGWGLTSASGTQTAVLNVIDLPVVSTEVCLQKSPKSYWEYITLDKLCAGYDNGAATLCQGDSGGGLAFPHMSALGVERYFLRGVVSTSPSSSSQCNAFAIASFTRLSAHRDFIQHRYRQHMDADEEPLPLDIGSGSPNARLPSADPTPDPRLNSTLIDNDINEVRAFLANNSRLSNGGELRDTVAGANLSQYQPQNMNRSFNQPSNRNIETTQPSIRRLRQPIPTFLSTSTKPPIFFNNRPTQNSPESDFDARFRRVQEEDLRLQREINRSRLQPDYDEQIGFQNNRVRVNDFNRRRAQAEFEASTLKFQNNFEGQTKQSAEEAYNQYLARVNQRVNQRDQNQFRTPEYRSPSVEEAYNQYLARVNQRVNQRDQNQFRTPEYRSPSAEEAYNQYLARINQGERVHQRDPSSFNQNMGPFAPTRTEEFTSTNTRCVNGQCTEDQENRSVYCVNGDCSVSESRPPSFGSFQSENPDVFS